jgi:hypothetical protein
METIIKQLTEQHPESVAQLLRAYGYDATPTVKNLTNLVKLHGNKPFIFSNNDGKEGKKTLTEKILEGVNAAARAVLILKDGKLPGNRRVVLGPDGIQENPEPTPRLFGINRTLFISLAALTVIAVAIILFKK